MRNSISKTDYINYRKTPIHLWAKLNGETQVETKSAQVLHQLKQGKVVEQLAKQYLDTHIIPERGVYDYFWQETFSDAKFVCRIDALLSSTSNNEAELIEVKAVNNIEKVHFLDLAFQGLLILRNYKITRYKIIHLDKDYVRKGEINGEEIFTVADCTEQVFDVLETVKLDRERLWDIAFKKSAIEIEKCTKPDVCPIPDICHPTTPEYSIYDIARIGKKKISLLQDLGIESIHLVPSEKEFPLTKIQREQVDIAQEKKPLVHREEIRKMFDKLTWPLYFLDFEAYNPAIPLFDGYSPYHFVPFQYSLHKLNSSGAKLTHVDYLEFGPADPGEKLAEQLLKEIGTTGSVLVWSKSFEIKIIDQLAERYPFFSVDLLNIKNRIFDLMDVFRKGHYQSPISKGSNSLKMVYPVFSRGGNYENLAINDGTKAMLAWEGVFSGRINKSQRQEPEKEMLDYCHLDTLATVEIWQGLSKLKFTEGRTNYGVYAFELNKEKALQDKKFIEANPLMKREMENFMCLYIGQTSKTPEERHHIHKNYEKGDKKYSKGSSRAHRIGVKELQPNLYEHLNPVALYSKNAEIAEKNLASELRKKGYGVWSR